MSVLEIGTLYVVPWELHGFISNGPIDGILVTDLNTPLVYLRKGDIVCMLEVVPTVLHHGKQTHYFVKLLTKDGEVVWIVSSVDSIKTFEKAKPDEAKNI